MLQCNLRCSVSDFGDAYRRRRPSGAGPDRAAAAASARASIETLAKRPSLGPGASPNRGEAAKKVDKGSGGEIVLEVGV